MQRYYAWDKLKPILEKKRIAVFGARFMALGVASCFMKKPYDLEILCFMVIQTEDNPSEFLGKPVISVNQAREQLPLDTWIVIAAMERNLEMITKSLHESGFYHLLPLTFESDLWSDVRGNYFMEYCQENQKEYLKLEEALGKGKEGQIVHTNMTRGNMYQKNRQRKYDKEDGKKTYGGARDVCIYTAKCHVDRELKEDLGRYAWEIPIQVGAALTGKQICEVRDNIGENISEKNREYCELTALYWIWKNTSSKYAGLCHYRRHFELDWDMLDQISTSDVDVVVTVPILNFPSVGAVYRQDHVKKDWEILMEAIETICPEYQESAKEVEEGIYYYGYNMFLARREILDDYCSWLFPLLRYCESYCEKKEDLYQNRYIGFLAERLLTVYLKQHEGQYQVAHVRKHFVEG